MVAAVKLVEILQAQIVGLSFLVELLFLQGKSHLKNYDVYSLIQYDEE